MKDLTAKLAKIQKELKAPKNQYNKFSNFNYRSCEDIMEAVKPLLGDLVLLVSDEIVVFNSQNPPIIIKRFNSEGKQVDEVFSDTRYYVKATATLTDGVNKISNVAFAREPLAKKGMDESQITGATSSYARKYALNGLFAIDDTKDADSQDNRPSQPITHKKSTKKDEKEMEEVTEAGLEKMKKVTCPLHKGRIFEHRFDHLGNDVFGHFWEKDDGTVLVCQGKGFKEFKPAE